MPVFHYKLLHSCVKSPLLSGRALGPLTRHQPPGQRSSTHSVCLQNTTLPIISLMSRGKVWQSLHKNTTCFSGYSWWKSEILTPLLPDDENRYMAVSSQMYKKCKQNVDPLLFVFFLFFFLRAKQWLSITDLVKLSLIHEKLSSNQNMFPTKEPWYFLSLGQPRCVLVMCSQSLPQNYFVYTNQIFMRQSYWELLTWAGLLTSLHSLQCWTSWTMFSCFPQSQLVFFFVWLKKNPKTIMLDLRFSVCHFAGDSWKGADGAFSVKSKSRLKSDVGQIYRP